MTPKQLLDAIGAVDEARLEQSEQAISPIRHIPVYRWAGLAACACLLILCLAVPNMLRMGNSYNSDAGAKEYSAESAAITEEAEDSYAEAVIPEQPAESVEAESVEESTMNDAMDSENAPLYGNSLPYDTLIVNGHSYIPADSDALQALHLDPTILNMLSAADRGDYLGLVRSNNEYLLDGAKAYAYADIEKSSGLILIEFPEETYALYILAQ